GRIRGMPASRWGSAPGLWRRRLLLRQVEKRIQGFPVVAGENRAPAIRRIARGASARRVLAPGWGSAPACQLRVLLLRQVGSRIDRFAVVAGENRAPAIRRITRGASARRVLAPGRGSAPACQLRRLLLRQVQLRIDRLAVVAGENRAPAIRRIARGASARRVLAPGRGSAPACQLRVLLLRQVEKRIDGFAVVAGENRAPAIRRIARGASARRVLAPGRGS